MTNLIFACWRDEEAAIDAATLRAVADRISPSVPSLPPPTVAMGTRAALCLTSPAGSAEIEGTSAHLGAFAGTWKEWHRPGAAVPDGTFALVRSGPDAIELCTDFSGSRTLWYAKTDRQFFASTSQRALVCLLEGLELNRSAYAWFLSSGTLGPTDAWDTRISRLPRESRLRLDRGTWETRLESAPVEFHPEPMARAQCRTEFLGILRAAVQSYDFSKARWIFPLSGGFDCRFILQVLMEGGWKPRTVTWGLEASQRQVGNDAYVARQLAEHYGLPHEYLLTERAEEPPAQVVDRFLAASSGATDQLFPYLDGMRLWSTFAQQGVDGVIRGDEGFGWVPAKTPQHARSSVGLVALRDFMPEALADTISGGGQAVPEALMPRPGEPIAVYRDRLYHAYRIPVGLAALNDVKAPFVEIASPLLSRPVLEFIRRMPDALRTEKALFTDIATAMSPAVPYASMGADDDRGDFLRSAPYEAWFEEEIQSAMSSRLLPTAFQEDLLAGLRAHATALAPSRSLRGYLKRIIPSSWVRAVRAQLPPWHPDRRYLAFRASLASRTLRMLEEDARLLKRS